MPARMLRQLLKVTFKKKIPNPWPLQRNAREILANYNGNRRAKNEFIADVLPRRLPFDTDATIFP